MKTRSKTIETITLDGRPFKVDKRLGEWDFPINGAIFGSMWERICCQALLENLRRDWNFLDIGASFGPYTFIAAARTNGTCYTFEPDEYNVTLLRANVGDEPNVVITEFALGEQQETLVFNCGADLGSNYIVNRGEKIQTLDVTHQKEAQVRRLDDFNISAKMVKIDVEGHGAKVIRGGLKTLKRAKIIMLELHTTRERGTYRTDEMESVDLLRDLNFDVTVYNAEAIFERRLWYRPLGLIARKI